MLKQKLMGISSIVFGCGTAVALSIPLSITSPATAQSCTPLRVVDGQGSTYVRKRISTPGLLPGVNNNWNTDFAVPTGRRFRSYIAVITPENAAGYNVAMNLKYNNNTSRQIYNRNGISLRRDVPYEVRANTPVGYTRQPYQVNLTISGTVGNTYQARVLACQ